MLQEFYCLKELVESEQSELLKRILGQGINKLIRCKTVIPPDEDMCGAKQTNS